MFDPTAEWPANHNIMTLGLQRGVNQYSIYIFPNNKTLIFRENLDLKLYLTQSKDYHEKFKLMFMCMYVYVV